METKIIDTRGRACPEPLIITRKAISGAAPGSRFEVLSDNDTARGNLMSYLASMGLSPECSALGSEFRIVFTIEVQVAPPEGGFTVETSVPGCSCGQGSDACGGYAVVIRSRFMGEGDQALGTMLMRSCVNSLAELDTPPSAVVLYNAGVMLAGRGTDTASALGALQAAGVDVVVCGTCVDYFGLKGRLSVGRISNMLEINNILSKSTRILYP